MNEIPLFRSQGDWEQWLETQSRTTHQKLALLNALRILPLAFLSLEDVSAATQQNRSETDRRQNDLFILAFFRVALCAYVAAWSDQEKYNTNVQTAREQLIDSQKLWNAQVTKANRTATALGYAASAGSLDNLSENRSAIFTAYSIWTGRTLIRDVISPSEHTEWRSDPELRHDINHHVRLRAPDKIKLFNKTICPKTIEASWKDFKICAEPPESPWRFWSDWYEGFLTGNPMDFTLQQQVALIDEAIWSSGPKAVAHVAGQMRARHDVQIVLNHIKESAKETDFDRFGIGGNHPPEVINDHDYIRSLELVRDATSSVEDEIAKATPNRDGLEAALCMLKLGLTGLIKWSGRKADLAVDTSIKWSIPVVGGAYLAAHPDKVQTLIKTVEEWLKFLP